MKKKLLPLFLILMMLLAAASSALAYESTTLHNGMKGDDVARMQQALIDQGYLSGTADGIFGVKTENAVRKFQKKHNLKADGLAGTKTLALLYQASSSSSASSASSSSSSTSASSASSSSSASSASSAASASSSSTLREGDSGEAVSALQAQLISLKYLSGTPDGKYGKQTRKAVLQFQKNHSLYADGIAGPKTLAALAAAVTAASNPVNSNTLPPDAGKITAPDSSELTLLHWFNDIKPKLKTKQTLLIYEPVSGLSWTLRVISRGRHLDAEPLTLQDTQIMLKAFDGKNTWNQKGVYVRLPDGRWTIGATHTMPHQTGNIPDNGFDGHLCVHFLRDMEECEKNDPNYGVSNQRTIRELWRKLTGEIISY